MSIAGPSGWKPPPLGVGFPIGPAILLPLLSNTRISGVMGLVDANSPPKALALSGGWGTLSLHRLGSPCPDSSTKTWKFSLLPRNAMPVGKFNPDANTSTLYPSGTTMSSPFPGLKKTSSPGQAALPAAVAGLGAKTTIRTSALSQTMPREWGLLMESSSPPTRIRSGFWGLRCTAHPVPGAVHEVAARWTAGGGHQKAPP